MEAADSDVPAMMQQIQSAYNQQDFRAIFQKMSPQMQKALPEPKTIDFFSGLFAQAGPIRQYKQKIPGQMIAQHERGVFLWNISVDDSGKIRGLLIKPGSDESLPQLQRNSTVLSLPFQDTWHVFWGGKTKEQNYHIESEAQKHAFDMIILDDKGSSHKGKGDNNQDYYAFGRDLLAPCDAIVQMVVDGVPDNIPGITNPVYVPGNTVILKTDAGEYLFFAHFRQHSIIVKQGQQVKKGQKLGECGNSGNSTEPHLHFHIQNGPDMISAIGVECFFSNILVNGKPVKEHSPVKGESIKPAP